MIAPSVAHTPGPWAFVKAGSFGWNIRGTWHGEPNSQLAYVDAGVCQTRGPFTDENTANARLIAAAPDLLAALKAVVAVSNRKTDAYTRAYAAIAKAEGNITP